MKGSGWNTKAHRNYQEIVGDKDYFSVIKKLLHGGGTIPSRRNKAGEAALFFPLGKHPISISLHAPPLYVH